MEKKILAGGISGGIADPDSERAIRHAETFYEGLRHRKTINAGAVIKQIPKENNRGGR